MTVIQKCSKILNDWRIVETLDEFRSIRTGYGKSSSLKYQTYYDLHINACVRYERSKKASVPKRGHIYQTFFTPKNDGYSYHLRLQIDHRYISDEFYQSIQINLVHLCLLDKNSSPVPSISKYISKETNQTEIDWSNLFARTYI